jgi:DNA-directed RNA polymerase specialized sigma24 family protein
VASGAPESLVDAVLAGDREAWAALWTLMEPKLQASLRRPGLLGRLARSDDDCRNIVLDVMEALSENGHARLAHFQRAHAENPQLAFWGWLDVVVRRRAIDYVRRQREFVDLRRRDDTDRTGAWLPAPVAVGSDSQLPGVRPPMTDRATAHQMMDFAGTDLTPEQRAALEQWVQGHGFAEIAVTLGLEDPRDAERRVRAALERLRRRFKDE